METAPASPLSGGRRPAAHAASALAIGAWLSALHLASIELFGAGPNAAAATAAAFLVALLLPSWRPAGWLRWVALPVGALLPLGAPLLLGSLPAPAVVSAAFLLAVCSTWAFRQVLPRQSFALNPLSGVMTALGIGLGSGVGARVGVLTAITLAAMLGRWNPDSVGGEHERRSVPSETIGARTFIVSAVCFLSTVAWALLRSPVLPVPAALLVGTAGGALGLGVAAPAPRAALAAGATGAGILAFAASALPDRMAALATVLGRVSPSLAVADRPAMVLYLAIGLTAGLLVGAAGGSGRERSLGTLAGLGLFLFAPPLADAALVLRAGTALVTTGADPVLRSRLDAQRQRLPVPFASFTAVGPAIVRGKSGQVMAELDGSVVDPESRAADGERFAATLGACLTPERGRARVAGDDMGLAVAALLAQGFRAIDTAVPDAARMRAWAELSPLAHKAWVHPATRILSLPAPFVAQSGDPADLVVNILRNGWTDARQALPSPWALAASRFALRPDGLYVLSITTTRIDTDTFLGLGHALADAFPSVTVWLPAIGVDTAIFVASPEAGHTYDYSALEGCIADDRDNLRRAAIRTPADLAGLLLADGTAIPSRPAPTALGLPQRLSAGDPSPLSAVSGASFDPATAWHGAEAVAAELRDRHTSLLRFQDALAHAAAGDMQAAIASARTLSTTTGGGRSVETLVRGYLDQARALIERAAKEGPESKSWEAADTALGNARLLYPDLAETWCIEGRMNQLRGQLPRAEDAYETCSEKDVDSLEALTGLGSVRRAMGNLTGAEEAMRKAVDRHPEAWRAKLNLGGLYVSLHRPDDAEPLLRQAVADSAKEPTPPLQPHLALANLYLATDRAALALSETNTVISLQPSREALTMRGEARLGLNQVDLAERDYRDALDLDPDYVPARFGLGRVQAIKGDYDGATASFKAVLALDPQSPEARANLQKLAQLGKD